MSAAPVAAKPSTIKDSKKPKRMRGVVVKKRTKPVVSPSLSDIESKSAKSKGDDNAPPAPKRRKIDNSS